MANALLRQDFVFVSKEQKIEEKDYKLNISQERMAQKEG